MFCLCNYVSINQFVFIMLEMRTVCVFKLKIPVCL